MIGRDEVSLLVSLLVSEPAPSSATTPVSPHAVRSRKAKQTPTDARVSTGLEHTDIRIAHQADRDSTDAKRPCMAEVYLVADADPNAATETCPACARSA